MRKQSFFNQSFQASKRSELEVNTERFKNLVLDTKADPMTYNEIWTTCLNMLCKRHNVAVNTYGEQSYYKWSTILKELYTVYLPKQGIFRTDLANLSLDDNLSKKVEETFGKGAVYNKSMNIKRYGNYLFAYFDDESYKAVNQAFYNMLLDEVKRCL